LFLFILVSLVFREENVTKLRQFFLNFSFLASTLIMLTIYTNLVMLDKTDRDNALLVVDARINDNR